MATSGTASMTNKTPSAPSDRQATPYVSDGASFEASVTSLPSIGDTSQRTVPVVLPTSSDSPSQSSSYAAPESFATENASSGSNYAMQSSANGSAATFQSTAYDFATEIATIESGTRPLTIPISHQQTAL